MNEQQKISRLKRMKRSLSENVEKIPYKTVEHMSMRGHIGLSVAIENMPHQQNQIKCHAQNVLPMQRLQTSHIYHISIHKRRVLFNNSFLHQELHNAQAGEKNALCRTYNLATVWLQKRSKPKIIWCRFIAVLIICVYCVICDPRG